MSEKTSELSLEKKGGQSIKRDTSSPQESKLKEFLTFERSCSSLTSGLPEILSFSVVLHTFCGYLLLSEHSLSPYLKNFIAFLLSSGTLYRLIQVVIYTAVMATLLCKLGAKTKNKTKIWYGTIKRVFSIYNVISRVLFMMTSFLLYIKFEEHLPLLILSVIVVGFDSLCMGNFSLKKEENYQTSHQTSLYLTFGKIIHVVANSIIVRFGSSTVFSAAAAIFGGLTLLWYSLAGYKLYIHKNPRRILQLFCSMVIASSLLFLLLIRPRKAGATFNLVQWSVALVVVTFYLYVYENKKRFTLVPPQKIIAEGKSPKDFQISLEILLQESDEDLNQENLLAGLLAAGIKSLNSQDVSSSVQKIFFDPLLKHDFNTEEFVREKDSITRFYARRLYQMALNQELTTQKVLDFTEFGVTERGDFSQHCLLLSELDERQLGFLQKIQLLKLQLIMKEESEAFNRLILGGKVELDEVLASQSTYESIMHDIANYCQKSRSVWTQALQRQVEVSVLKCKLSENFQLIPKINQQWNNISKFLGIQRHWKFVYLNFALFLKNEKIKSKDFTEDSFNYQSIRSQQNERTPLRGSHEKDILIKDSFFFDKQSAVLTCELEEKTLKFFKVSKHFESLTGYSEAEINGSPLSTILPLYLKDSHDTRVIRWLDQGYSIDEGSYFAKNTHFVDKFEKEIPAIVIFKLYVDLAGPGKLLKFVSLMKTSLKEGEDKILNSSVNLSKYNKSSSTVVNILQRQLESCDRGVLKLDPSYNIFLKDENLQPETHMNEVQNMKTVMRLMTLTLIIVLAVLNVNLKNSFLSIKEYAEGSVIFANMYNSAMNLGQFYNMITMIPNNPLIIPRIATYTNLFNKYKNNPLTNRILFDRSLNLPNSYPPFRANTINQNISYSEVDIFFIVVSGITTLKKQTITGAEYDFLQFDSYIKPGFDQMMNSTKQQLHLRLQQSLSKIKSSQVINNCILIAVMLLMGVYLCFKIHRYFAKMQEVVNIIVDFSNEEMRKIIDYWNKISEHFNHIQGKQSSQLKKELRSESSEEEEENLESNQPKATLNQKQKNLVVSEKEKRKTIKMWVMMGILLIGYIPTVLVIQGVNIKQLKDLASFEEAGYFALKHFPTTNILNMEIFNHLFSNSFPTYTFDPNRFEDTLSNLELMINYKYLPDLNQKSAYYQKIQNYFFGNPCTFNPQVLVDNNLPLQFCLTVAGRSFTSGISASLRYLQPQIIKIHYGELTMPVQAAWDIAVPLDLTTMYIADAISTWLQQFQAKLEQANHLNLLLTVFVSLLMFVLHFFLFQMYMMPTLIKDYQFMKNVFETCVPEAILTKQKIIKHRFYQSGILRAN